MRAETNTAHLTSRRLRRTAARAVAPPLALLLCQVEAVTGSPGQAVGNRAEQQPRRGGCGSAATSSSLALGGATAARHHARGGGDERALQADARHRRCDACQRFNRPLLRRHTLPWPICATTGDVTTRHSLIGRPRFCRSDTVILTVHAIDPRPSRAPSMGNSLPHRAEAASPHGKRGRLASIVPTTRRRRAPAPRCRSSRVATT
jgi:hypothetical protein